MKCINSCKCKIIFFICFILLCMLSGCSSETENDAGTTTNLFIQMEWPIENRAWSETEYSDAHRNICEDYGITEIEVTVHSPSGQRISQSNWKCQTHKGTVSGVSAGSGYEISVIAHVNDGEVWEANEENILLAEGKNTVRVKMAYNGPDHHPPSVLSSIPQPSEAAFPIHEKIRVTFDDDLMHSSINDASFYLQKKTARIRGTIVHQPGSDTIYFEPDALLDYDSEYRLILTNQILDSAGNPTAEAFQLSFHTARDAQNALNPPTGFKGEGGYRMISFSWDEVSGASGYNIYMSKSSTVSKDPNGYLKVERVTGNTYEWKDLDPMEPYYFILTAVNPSKESDATDYITETPSLIPFQKDLVAFYDFVDATMDVKDLSENKNHGFANHVQAAKDRFGTLNKAIYFNGETSYVQINHLNGLDPANFTIVIIFRPFENPKDYWIFTKGYQDRNFSLQVYGEAKKNAGILFYSHVNYTGPVNETCTIQMGSKKVPINIYTHVAITYEKIPNATIDPYRFNAYINGKKGKNVDTFEPPANDSPFIIGAGGAEAMSEFYKGVIDDLIIFNRALSEKEIAQMYEFSEMNKPLLTNQYRAKEKNDFVQNISDTVTSPTGIPPDKMDHWHDISFEAP